MSKNVKKILFISIFLVAILLIFNNNKLFNKYNTENIDTEKVYKVALYNHPPYYFINEKAQPSGYYHELMELISKNLDIKYEYVNSDIDECIGELVNNEVDLVFGVSKDTSRKNEILFSKYSVGSEDVSVFTNENIKDEDLNQLDGFKFGYLPQESNNDLIVDILNQKNIDVEIIKYKSYEELKQGFIKDEVDSIVYLSSDKNLEGYDKILNFSIGELYLTTSVENNDLINQINLVFENNLNLKYKDSIDKLHDKYFNKILYTNKNNLLVSQVIIFIIGVGAIFKLYKYLKKENKIKKKKNKIIIDLKDNKYLLFYQPIINPKTRKIKGFEGLLRLKNKDEIIPPYILLKEIEQTNMMKDVSLWVLKKAINDYSIIQKYECVADNDFYISINLSFKELEDEKFIEDIKDVLKNSDLKPNSICLEIIEKFGINDLNQIQNAIDKLKESGFIVAIDDFGVEYSNLDILEKIDCDVVKLDKFFIDDIRDSYIRNQVVHFIANVCKYTDKTVICEGVETECQKDIIKNMNNDKFYIQGYYYSKPREIEDLKNFKLK